MCIRDSARPPRDAVLECRTVFLSDLHLGTKDCKADECRRFLKHVRAEKIVLVGDIVDAWALSRGSRWRRRHTRLIRTLLKKMEPVSYTHLDVYKRQSWKKGFRWRR